MFCGVAALCLAASVTFGADVLNVPKWAKGFECIAEKGSPKDVDWSKAVQTGSSGNVRVYFDKKGNPEVYVIGVAPVSTKLIALRAEQLARKEAEINAKAAFALWLHEHFAVKDEFDQKVLVVIRDASNESAEDRTVSKRHAEQFANGSWRGMRCMEVEVKSGRCYAVWRWSLTEHTFAKMIEIFTKGGNPERKHDNKVREGKWSRF